MGRVAGRPVQPEMHGRDRRRRDFLRRRQEGQRGKQGIGQQSADSGPRNGEHEKIEFSPRVVRKDHGGCPAAVAVDPSYARSAVDRRAAIGEPRAHAPVDPLSQRQPRQAERVGVAGGEKAVDKDLSRGGQRGAVGRIGQGAEDDRPPKPRDGLRRLSLRR